LLKLAVAIGVLASCSSGVVVPERESTVAERALDSPVTRFDLGRQFFMDQDYETAVALWQSVIETGGVAPGDKVRFRGAENNLGYCRWNGLGIQQDRAEAIRLWRIAAEDGHPEAQFHLGRVFLEAEGGHRDLVEAYAWFWASYLGARSLESDFPHFEPIARAASDAASQVGRSLPEDDVLEAQERGTKYYQYSLDPND
jgi:hypothetical protein